MKEVNKMKQRIYTIESLQDQSLHKGIQGDDRLVVSDVSYYFDPSNYQEKKDVVKQSLANHSC